MSYFEIMFLACVGITAVSIVATLANVALLMGTLKRRCPEEFERLGSPHIFMNNTPRTNLNIFTFLKDREYEALRDQKIIAAAGATRKLYVATFFFFALSLILLFVVWGRG